MEPAKEIIIQFTLPMSDQQGARDLLQHIYTVKDPLYHHYLTVQEIVDRFGANPADYAAVRAWAVANGLTVVHEAAARTSLSVRGTVAQLQTLFKTQLNYYKAPSGDQFYSASVAPTVPSELVSKIRALVGLTGGVQNAALYKIGKILGEYPETSQIHTDTAGGTGPGGTFAASDLRTAYEIPKFGGLVGQTVAVFEDTGIHASDYDKYLTENKLPSITLKQIPVDQSTAAINGDQVEAVLDVDMIAGINPDVKEIQLYAAPGAGTISQFSSDLIDVFDAVLTASASANGPHILSVSYGLDEIQIIDGGGDIYAEGEAILNLANAGVTVLVSAGDQGAYGRTGTNTYPATLNVGDPGSQEFVTCVGGTSLHTGPKQQYYGETVWDDLGIGDGATGGGVSGYWGIESYQGAELVTWNGGNSVYRNVPDVSAIGDPLTGVGIYVKAAGGWIQLGGTSVSAPIWAGYISILNSAADYLKLGQVGFFDYILYYTATDFYNGNYYSPAALGLWYPVLDGTNGNYNLYGTAGYTAGEYYNNCTGLGSLYGPYAYQVLTDVAPESSLEPTGLKATVTDTSAKITWKAVSGASGYALYFDEVISVGPDEYDLTASAEASITKTTTFTISGLAPKTYYALFVGTVVGSPTYESGSSYIIFETK